MLASARGGVKTPPYNVIQKGCCRGEHCSPAAHGGGHNASGAMTGIAPYTVGADSISARGSMRQRKPRGGVKTAWRRTTSAASQQSWPAHAVVCPAGANIVRSPVSLRSTVAPRSQPRSARPLRGGGNPINFAKNSKFPAQNGAKPLDVFVIIVLAVSVIDCQPTEHLNTS